MPNVKIDIEIPQDMRPVKKPEKESGGVFEKLANFPLRRELIFSIVAHVLAGTVIHEDSSAKFEVHAATELKVEKSEILDELTKERAKKIDEYINKYLDEHSDSYLAHEIPGEETYFALDAINSALEELQRRRSKEFDKSEFDEKVTENETYLQTKYQERLKKILDNPNLTFTGNVVQDFYMLQEAMFFDEDNLFDNKFYGQSQYQKTSADFKTQLNTGVVNCQVSRSSAILLNDIYKAKGIARKDLQNMRAIVWNDHIASAYLFEDGSLLQMQELNPRAPFFNGPASKKTGEAGKVMNIRNHLAYYLYKNGASDEQMTKIKALGFVPDVKSRYLDKEIDDKARPLFEFESGESPQYTTHGTESYSSEVGLGISYLIKNEINKANSGLYQIPSWLGNEDFEEYILKLSTEDNTFLGTYISLLEIGKTHKDIEKFVEKARQIYPGKEILNFLNRTRYRSKIVLDILSQNPEFVEEWDKIFDELYSENTHYNDNYMIYYLQHSVYLEKQKKLKTPVSERVEDINKFYVNDNDFGTLLFEDFCIKERYRYIESPERIKQDLQEFNFQANFLSDIETFFEIEKKYINEPEKFFLFIQKYMEDMQNYHGGDSAKIYCIPAVQRQIMRHPEYKEKYIDLFSANMKKLRESNYDEEFKSCEFFREMLKRRILGQNPSDELLVFYGLHEEVKGKKYEAYLDIDKTIGEYDELNSAASLNAIISIGLQPKELREALKESYFMAKPDKRLDILSTLISIFGDSGKIDKEDLYPEDLMQIKMMPESPYNIELKAAYMAPQELSKNLIRSLGLAQIFEIDFEEGMKMLKKEAERQ